MSNAYLSLTNYPDLETDERIAKLEQEWLPGNWPNGQPHRVKRFRRKLVVTTNYQDKYFGKKNKHIVGSRAAISELSDISSRRLRGFIENYYRDFKVFITLTYGSEYPMDGREVKRHMNNFFERIRKTQYFAEESMLWFLEFQKRGAPHIHILATGYIDKNIIASYWSQVSGAPEKTSTRTEGLRNPDRAGVYAAKYAAKQEQKGVPEGFVNPGRFWGVRGAKPPKKRVPSVSAAIDDESLTIFLSALTSLGRSKYLSKNISFVYHEAGLTVYGDEREINQLWHCLLGAGRSADLTERWIENFRHPI